MRKVFTHGTILAIACMMVGCNQQPLPDTFDGIVISADLPENDETRTSISGPENNKYEIHWQTGDKISINGIVSNELSSAYNGKREAEFTIPSTPSGNVFKVLYPGTTSDVVITLPATQTYTPGSFDKNAAAAYGTANYANGKYSVKMSGFCGIIRFALKGSATLDRIVINSLGGQMLSGPFNMIVDRGGFTGAFSEGSTASESVTLNFGDPGLTLTNTDTYVYVPIPAQTYTTGGVEALVYQKDGAFMRLKFWGSGKVLDGETVVEFESKTFAAGRTENLLQINSLTAEAGGEPTATPPGITVAVYNVLKSGDRNKLGTKPGILLSNSGARAALGVAIKNTEADIIGFNEIGDDMYASDLANSIQDIGTEAGLSSDPTNGYDWKFFSTTSSAYHYANGFAYNKSVLEHISSTRVWLSPTGNTYGTSRYSTDDPDRTCVYAKFKHKPSQKQFWVLVTQLPTAKQTGNTSMSAGVNKLAQDKCGSLPQILVGDMNSVDVSSHDNQAGAQKLKEYWTDAYEYIEANIPADTLEDWYYYKYPGTLSGTGSANDSSSNYQYDILTYTKRKFPERRIDHIMTHGACTVTSYRTVRNTYVFDPDPNVNDDEVSYAPSDHLPVVCYITLD